ncbi:MAG: hypothetical protein LBB88_04850 [Planctomycetaceae bacterium]|jgi:flagellar biogenesis protein FliO|nr:hypothetical protein [Planctomycetaceae bacterium]
MFANRRNFLYKILSIAAIIVFFTNINICPADTPDNSDFSQEQYSQNQKNYRQNNYPNNSNLSNAAFGKEITPDIAAKEQHNRENSIREQQNQEPPLHEPLPLPPKPSSNYKKNNQLNALKSGLTNSPTPQTNNQPINSHATNSPSTNSSRYSAMSADYNRSSAPQRAIKLAAADSQENQINNRDINSNPNQNNQSNNSTNNTNSSEKSSNNDDDRIIVTENQKTQNENGILDQKIGLGDSNDDGNKLKKPRMPEFFGPVVSVVSSLFIVISIFLILTLLFRKISPNATQTLPKEVFENLGKTFLSQKLQVYLLRLGNRLILVSATGDALTPITEITDPDEVVTVLGMCRTLNNNAINKFHKNLSAQLNSNNFNESEKNYTAKNNRNDYFGINQNEQEQRYKSRTSHGLDIYSEPDNKSLASILASGMERKGVKS